MIVSVIAAAAASPSWTDIVGAGAAVVGVIGVVSTLGYSAVQNRRAAEDQHEALQVQMAQRALSLMQLLIDIERVLVERTYLAPYFQSGQELPKVDRLRNEVLAYALLFSDFGETVGWQINNDQMSKEGALGWKMYLEGLHEKSAAVRHVLKRDGPILAGETRWLFGVGQPTEAVVRCLQQAENQRPDTPLELRDLRSKREPELLEAVYRYLFVPNFPDPDEQEEPSDWIPRLWGEPSPPHPEQHGFVAGTRLDDAATRVVAGFAFVERYRGSRCALLSYIAVDQAWRGRRLARTLFEQALDSARQAGIADGAPLRAVFAEIHDPRRVEDTSDVINPAKRAQIMAQLGAQLIPIDYVQPALGGDSERSDRLLLIAFPQDGKDSLDAGVVRDFLLEYFSALHVPNPADDADVIRMTAELGPGRVELVPLDDLARGK